MASAEFIEELLGFGIFAIILYFIMPVFDKTKISKKERWRKALLMSLLFTVIDLFIKFLR